MQVGWEGFARRRRETFGSHICVGWDPMVIVAAPTLKNGNGTTCVLLGMGIGREVGMFCNSGTKWDSTKIEMRWAGTVVS